MKKLVALILCLLLCLIFCLSAGASAENNHDSIYQVALLQSLAQGHLDGMITVGELKKHGDTGIGTFDGLNGEMIVLDGVVYQAIYDGSIVVPPDSETVPFSNVTFFEPDINQPLSNAVDMATLQDLLNKVVNEHGANLFYMVKITGAFSAIKVRSEYKQEKPYRNLDVALAADQTEFDYKNIRGTMVGLYCPSFMGGLNSIGWHFHFITEDLTRGGHVLQVSIDSALAEMDATPGFELMLPDDDAAFQRMNLSRNMDEAIHRAETATLSDENSGTGEQENEKIDYLVLVNKLNPLPEGWEEALQTVMIINSVGDEVEVEKKAYEAYLRLKADLEENDGIYLELDSARRSVAAQQDIMDRFTEKYGADYAAKTVAAPGYSEHHTGLALDLYFRIKNTDGTFTDVYYNEDMTKPEYDGIWDAIHAKLANYGFILRYLKGKEYITGYGYEPWHIRYIDSVETAKEIMKQGGMTLEVWLGAANDSGVTVDYGTSELYSAEDLEEAAVQVKCRFAAFAEC